MYKAKLQELCHQKRWGLPKYSALRDGPDHEPRFKASVSVNGGSFDSPQPCNSSKQAHNEAAKLAYLHFTSPFPDVVSNAPKVDNASEIPDHSNTSGVEIAKELKISSTSAQPNEGGPKIKETCYHHKVQSDSLGMTDDEWFENCQYKNQLKNYVKWKQFDVPLYSIESEGPPHALNYKSTVIGVGHTFQSSEVCHTPEKAKHAAAKASLLPLPLDSFPKNDSVSYKNLLLELTQREGFFMPAYKTTQSGPPHSSAFLSKVEVKGEIYCGKAANSKKQAEQNAAMAAYTALNESGLGQTMSSNLVVGKALETSTSSGLTRTVVSHQNPKNESHSTSSPSTKHEEHTKQSEVEEVASLKAWIEDSSPERSSSCSAIVKARGRSAEAVSDVNTRKTTGTDSYLLCNRYRVYPYYPDSEFPEGITVLPIRDNKWVAVSLEFPNEIGD